MYYDKILDMLDSALPEDRYRLFTSDLELSFKFICNHLIFFFKDIDNHLIVQDISLLKLIHTDTHHKKKLG